jgi:hypothetical protein
MVGNTEIIQSIAVPFVFTVGWRKNADGAGFFGCGQGKQS